MYVYRRLIAAYLHRRRIVLAAHSLLNIFGYIYKHHTRFARLRNIESLFYCCCKAFAAAHGNGILGDASHHSHNVCLLKGVVSYQRQRDLPRKADERNAVVVGGRYRRDEIGRARAARYKAYAGASRRTGIAVRRMSKSLFVARKDNIYTFIVIECVKKVYCLPARIGKQNFNILSFQSLYK